MRSRPAAARSLPPATTRVAAIQGNIAQTLKFNPSAFYMMLGRYVSLTQRVVPQHPAVILWPETVIPAKLNAVPWLKTRFGTLARQAHAELIVGSFDVQNGATYNALYYFGPDGKLQRVYRKRQLVPFAEHLPFARVLSWIPWTREIGGIGIGTTDGVGDANGVVIGPIVCWESAFSNMVVADVRAGPARPLDRPRGTRNQGVGVRQHAGDAALVVHHEQGRPSRVEAGQ